MSIFKILKLKMLFKLQDILKEELLNANITMKNKT